MDELTLDGKIYISSKRAAKITGYARDYVGQLCREGHVEARLVGRNWYVLETSIREHRFGVEKQIEPKAEEPAEVQKPQIPTISTWESPKYVTETAPVLPALDSKDTVNRINSANTNQNQDDPVAQMQAAWKDWFSVRKQQVLIEPEPEEVLLESPEILDAREHHVEEIVPEKPYIASYETETVHEEPVLLKKVADVIETKREQMRSEHEMGAESVQVRRKYVEKPVQSSFERVKPATVATPATYEREKPVMDRKTRIKLARQKEKELVMQKRPNMLLKAFFVVVILGAVAVALAGTGNLDQYIAKYVTQFQPLQFLVGERIVNKN